MKAIAAIIEPAAIDLDLLGKQLAVALSSEGDAQRTADRHSQAAATAREAARARRLEVGQILCRARPAWPERGPTAKGWGTFIGSHGLDDATARRYMDEYRDPSGFAQRQAKASDPTPRAPAEDDLGPRIAPPDQQRDTPPFRALSEADIVQGLARLDAEAQKRILRGGRANVAGGSGDAARGKWCTPKALAVAVGPWDLDPFSNPRSHIAAVHRCQLEDGGDGFGDGGGFGRFRVRSRDIEEATEETRVWIQPPYELVLDAIEHYGHTRFCALLRWSPDVEWFARLWPRVRAIAFPRERIEFEPPPGIESSGGAPYPHALHYADERDITDEIRALCIVLRVAHSQPETPDEEGHHELP